MDSLYRRSPLVYPSGVLPGFDSTHIAATNCRFSGVAVHRNFLDLTTGRLGVPGTGAGAGGTATIHSHLGPGVSIASTAAISFAGRPLLVDQNVTIAFIAYITNGLGTLSYFFTTDSAAGSGWAVYYGTTGFIHLVSRGVTDLATTTAVAAFVPYFIVVSYNHIDAKVVAKRLDTGAVTSSVTASVMTPLQATGTCIVGDTATTGGSGAQAIMAAAMYSGTALSLGQMLNWANDPWSFWYPQPEESWVGVTAAVDTLFAQACM